MKNAAKPKIIVAGGGIGGLTAALSLIKRGFEVEIYEQAPILQEIGAGVQISANGMLVFHELGLATRVMEEAAHPERREIRMWNTGQAWTAFDLGTVSVQTYGHPYVTMFRPDLLGILSDAVSTAAPGALRLGHRAVGCETAGARVILRFDDGSTAEGDALIGADGIHSVIRAGLHGSDNAEFTGLVAWRGVIPMQDLPPRLARSVSSNWVGPGRHVVQYPLRRGTLMNFVGVVEREDWREESWTTPGSHADMLADFAGWHDDVQTLIAAIPQPYLWALKLRRPLPSWSVGRVTLLGDACHPTLPFLAQGAVMAIEDGYIVSRALEAHGMDVAAVGGSPAALAAQAATRTVPIVFEVGADPVALGLVSSLSKPGGNLTGVTSLNVEAGQKRLEMLHEIFPTEKQVAVLINPTGPTALAETAALRVAATSFGLQLNELRASSSAEIEVAFSDLRSFLLIIIADPFFTSASEQLAALATRHRVAAIHQSRRFVKSGGLLSYGGNFTDSHRIAGNYTGRVLKGEKTTDLAVQQTTKIEMVINLTAAKALGIDIPQATLTRADEVIE